MDANFLHDISNLLAIAQGKLSQAERLLAEAEPGASQPRERVLSALKALDRMQELLIRERDLQEQAAGKKGRAA